MQGLLFMVKNRDNIWCNLMHLKKGVMDCKLEHLNIETNEHQHTKTTDDEKVYMLNQCLFSNWKTIYPKLKYPNNGPHAKVPLIFWVLILTFNSCFHHQLWIKWVCIEITIRSWHIGQTNSRFPKCLWMFDTEWNAHQIGIIDKLGD